MAFSVNQVAGQLQSKNFWVFVGVILLAILLSLYINPYLRGFGVPIIN